LEIQGGVEIKKETKMYPESGKGAKIDAKFLKVRAVKKGAASDQKLCKKLIKLEVIDHDL